LLFHYSFSNRSLISAYPVHGCTEREIEVDNRIVTVDIDIETETASVVSVESEMGQEIRHLVEDNVAGRIRKLKSWGDDGVSEKVMVKFDTDDLNKHKKNNLFAGPTLDPFYEAGYVPVAVANEVIWFRRASNVLDVEDVA